MFVAVIGLLFITIKGSSGVSSPLTPFTNYSYSISMRENVSDLWWNVDEVSQEIVFELHVNTNGWIALGISPAGGMAGADIALSWIDQNGRAHIQDRYAVDNSRPVVDSTSADWIVLQGREVNGWTAIQFKRKFDSCDSMDVPIRTGTNHLIHAYGLVDPDLSQPNNDITYHENRRNTRILSLRAYTDVPPVSKFAALDSIHFRVDNFTVPTVDTTYYCQVFRTPRNITRKRHAIAYEILIDPNNVDLVHHLLLYECGSTVSFNDDVLPKGLCSVLRPQISSCLMNGGTGWAVGGNTIVEYPAAAGYPFETNFSVVYYVMQMHYNNPQRTANRVDRSGIRFILGNELRQYDVAYLTLGAASDPLALAIPPQTQQFRVDSFCPSEATLSIPPTGITVFAALPHTHLQGRSVWTKLVRNGAPIDYLHNAESYDFNHQMLHQLPTPITLYPGDAFYIRCVYNTMDKQTITLGGESTSEEMCLHFFAYYPRVPSFYTCANVITPQAWTDFANDTSFVLRIELFSLSSPAFRQWLGQRPWTDTLRIRWQQFYDTADRYCLYGESANLHYQVLALPRVSSTETSSCLRPNSNPVLSTSHSIVVLGLTLASLLF